MNWLELEVKRWKVEVTTRPVISVVVSVSTSQSRDSLETYQCLVSISSREKLSRSRLGLGHLHLMPKTDSGPSSHVQSWLVIAVNKTCTLMSRSRLESYKRLVLVSSRLVKPMSRSREVSISVSSFLRLVPIPARYGKKSLVQTFAFWRQYWLMVRCQRPGCYQQQQQV